jgi:uncharacterized damage-inducible protein DinB
MEVREELLRMFDYDLWANVRWFPLCSEPPYRDVMEHIIRSQVIWLDRCGGQKTFAALDPYDLVESIHLAWQAHLDEADLSEIISSQTSFGVKFQNSRLDIARQVINHGTYHRGQLRAMVEAAGITGFPETDYLWFLNELKG